MSKIALTSNSIKKGKSAEYYLVSELLKWDFDVYFPIADVHGIDILVRGKNGKTVEIQSKSRVLQEDLGRIYEVKEKEVGKCGTFFIAVVLRDKEKFHYWLFPWEYYCQIASYYTGNKSYRLSIRRLLNIKENDKYNGINGLNVLISKLSGD